MIEDHQAVVETDVALGQFKIIDRPADQPRLDKVLQIVSPVAEAAAERKWPVQFLEQFVTRHQTVKQMPGIAKLDLPPVRGRQFAARAEGAEGQEGPSRDKRITSLWRIEPRAAQQHHARLIAESPGQRFRGVLRRGFLNYRAHRLIFPDITTRQVPKSGR